MKLISVAVLLSLLLLLNVHSSHQVVYSCNSTAACGCSAYTASVTRIVGGEVAGSSTWGWAVSIKLGTGGLCGGAIIASQWILTAAHCVSSYTASQITVYAGSNTMWTAGQSRSVMAKFAHSSYSSSTKQNDIALLQLSSALNMADPNVKIACIPSVSSSTLFSRRVASRQCWRKYTSISRIWGSRHFPLHRSWRLVGAQRRRVDLSPAHSDKWRWIRSLPLHRCAAQSSTTRRVSSVPGITCGGRGEFSVNLDWHFSNCTLVRFQIRAKAIRVVLWWCTRQVNSGCLLVRQVMASAALVRRMPVYTLESRTIKLGSVQRCPAVLRPIPHHPAILCQQPSTDAKVEPQLFYHFHSSNHSRSAFFSAIDYDRQVRTKDGSPFSFSLFLQFHCRRKYMHFLRMHWLFDENEAPQCFSDDGKQKSEEHDGFVTVYFQNYLQKKNQMKYGLNCRWFSWIKGWFD